MAWDYKRYGSKEDPIRQSDLNEIAGTYGCGARFRYRKVLEAEQQAADEVPSSKRSVGTIVHEAIATYLRDDRASARVFGGELPSVDAVALVIRTLAARESADIDAGEREAAVHMVRGALAGLVVKAERVQLVEAAFLAEVEAGERSFFISGTVDVVYTPRGKPGQIGLADWKTGETRLHPIILQHGYQFGFYSHALATGEFAIGPNATRVVGQHPDEIFAVHLRDHVPYQRAGKKKVERAEDAAFWGVEPGSEAKYTAGQERGPAWYRADRTPEQVARLAHSIRTLVGVVRRGGFVESIGEHCMRCPYKARCLNEGYGATGEERDALEKALRGLTGTDDGLAA
jgi:hypothetical protein